MITNSSTVLADPKADAIAVPASQDGRWWALVVALLFFAAIAPTLGWMQFCNGMENSVVATALQMRRGGPVLFPMLQDAQRTKKPPMAAWIAAVAMRPHSVRAITADQAQRDAAFQSIAWQVRLPALAFACLTLLAAYALGKQIAGWEVGLASALVCGSSVLFLRLARYATTDVQLALWVTVANAFFAAAIFRGRWWLGCIGGSLALGLAFMSKGPVSLVQTLLPYAAFVAWNRWWKRPRVNPPRRGFEVRVDSDAIVTDRLVQQPATADADLADLAIPRVPWAPVAAGLALMLAVGLPWYLVVLMRTPNVTRLWFAEVTRVGADAEPGNPWYSYLMFIPLLFPWLLFFIAGLVEAGSDFIRGRRSPIVLAMMLCVLPILVMGVSEDRKDRYLLPMLGPAAVLSAWSMLQHLRRTLAAHSPLRVAHWIATAIVVVALPIAGAHWLRGTDGAPWYSPAMAVTLAVICVAIIVTGVAVQRRHAWALIGATVAVMLALQAAFMWGYRKTDDGKSEAKPLADVIWAHHPEATVYSYRTAQPKRHAPMDLSIYLNRILYRANDLDAIIEVPGPQVLVLSEKKLSLHPSWLRQPSGWKWFARVRCGNDDWSAYYRESIGATSPSQ